eukprot:CAMPEP_0170389264 /NCGR_PEP_ID=MMETSP0117_2-20130122/18526_1 /TAXON_ID=400756 /ORGANISM="Durinskia baltica, Strain CSIRO CS-38" /LENGTH=102 /DNA_ID=CAMNT_0010645243 /DNA_START=198 /DNA_END=506 /DNA_ORIENTATION=-
MTAGQRIPSSADGSLRRAPWADHLSMPGWYRACGLDCGRHDVIPPSGCAGRRSAGEGFAWARTRPSRDKSLLILSSLDFPCQACGSCKATQRVVELVGMTAG